MSCTIVEKPVFLEERPSSYLPPQIETCPEELAHAVSVIERFAEDLLKKVGMAVNCVKLKLLLPVETYSRFHWFQSYVLTEDLMKLNIDVKRFDQTRIHEGMAVSVRELEKHHLEVTKDHNHRAKWYPTSTTIKISAKVLDKALQLVLFELTNASTNREHNATRSSIVARRHCANAARPASTT